MERGDELLTVEEGARLLTISKPTLWRMLRTGELPVVRIAKRGTRVKRSDIEAYIARHYITEKPNEGKGD